MGSFNQALIARTIKYFKERCGQDISPETAEEYLNSMADLYGCFIEFLESDKKEEIKPLWPKKGCLTTL